MGRPDDRDIHRLPSQEITATNECFNFEKAEKDYGDIIKFNDWTTDLPRFRTLSQFVKEHKARSCIVIQNDSIKFEYYDEKLNSNSLHPSYSIAKAFTSTLIGLAIADGFIDSEQDLVSKYIPEWNIPEKGKNLKIEHLLNQTSGIKFTWVQDAQIYYGNDIWKAIHNIQFDKEPGEEQHYLNITYQLLGIILERVTGKSVSEYLQEKIWQPLGMCSDAIWTIDKKNKQEKTFCCLGATTQDYAKFGRLYLNGGNWNGKQIIPKDWYEKAINRNRKEGSSDGYNYGFFIGLKEYGGFMASGMDEQHIYMMPKKNLIIVVLNNKIKKMKEERMDWQNTFRQIADCL